MAMGNPFETTPFDPNQYRQDLMDKIRAKKAEYEEKILEAEKTGRRNEIVFHKINLKSVPGHEIKLAKCSEEYHRAKLMRRGDYSIGDNGECIDNRTGLSTQDMANQTKLMDSLDYNVNLALKTLSEVRLPEEVIKSEKFREKAEELLTDDYVVYDNETGDESYSDAPQIIRFAKTFGIEDRLKAIISQQLDHAAKEGGLERAKKLLEAYPYFDIKDYRARLKSKYYPIPEGLRHKAEPDKLFGDLLEGPEPEISLEKIIPSLAENAELLANDLKSHPYLYWDLKHCILNSSDYRTHFGSGRWSIRKLKTPAGDNDERQYLTASYNLEESETPSGKKPPTRLEFRFSCDKEDLRTEAYRFHDTFTSTKMFAFEGLYIGDKRPGSGWGKENDDRAFARIDKDPPEPATLSSLTASKKALKELAIQLLKPKKDFGPIQEKMSGLAEKWGMTPEEIQSFSQAIEEFGIYMYRREESNIGECLIIPNEFASFCSTKFGIRLETARYGEYHPEWGSSGGYEPYTFFHEVNILSGHIVVDWTATQYAKFKGKPIPYIYEIGDEREKMGPLYKTRGQATNEQYINDENDPLFRKEKPVDYGI